MGGDLIPSFTCRLSKAALQHSSASRLNSRGIHCRSTCVPWCFKFSQVVRAVFHRRAFGAFRLPSYRRSLPDITVLITWLESPRTVKKNVVSRCCCVIRLIAASASMNDDNSAAWLVLIVSTVLEIVSQMMFPSRKIATPIAQRTVGVPCPLAAPSK